MSVEGNLHELAMEHLRSSNLSPVDLVAALRECVESGTIKGEVVTGELGDNALEFYQPDSGYGHIYIVIGPVSDGGSET